VREALIARLDDSSEAVVGLAARSLGAIGGPGAPQALQRCALNEAQSIWTRATAVQAAAPLFHRPQTWMRRLAGQYTGSTRPDQVKFRGAVIDAVLRGAWDDEVATWAGEVLLTDTDPINQTAAATALGRNRQMTIPLARRFLSPRSGVRDPAAAGAVLRAAIMSAAPDRELLAAAAGLLRQTTMHRAGPRVAAGAALSAVAVLDSDSAEGFLGELEARLSEEERARFLPLLQRQREQLDRRLADEAAYRALAGRPERFLTAFSDDVAEGGDMVSESCDIGIVTIIGEEARAVRGWLEGLDPDARSLGPGKRYVYRASCTAGEASARIVMTQAAEQSQTSAATAAQYLARHFSPRFLILLGIAGGIHSDVGLGDVVIGTHVIDYGPAASTPEGVKHRGAAFRPPLPVVTALNDFFSGVGEPCKLTAHPDSAELGKDSFSLQRGPIGTGPRVVKFKEAEERKFLLDFNEKTLALETEAEAIARHFYEQGEDGELTGYIVLRAISDHADEAKDDKWKLAASRNAVLALQAILPLVMEVL
jgi:adenosylhomocysteine nucleosidase